MSPNKTLYIKDDDLRIWERADEVAKSTRQSTSQLATTALRRYLFPTSPKDLDVFVAGEADDITFSDSDGKPLLIYKRHPEHGMGWVLYTEDGDDHFIPGGIADVDAAVQSARDELNHKAVGENEQIRVDVGDQTVGFVGRWLVEPDRDETRTGEEGYDAGAYWGVALTRRGRIAVYTAHCNDRWPGKLEDFDSLKDARESLPADIYALAEQELGGEGIIWRDI